MHTTTATTPKINLIRTKKVSVVKAIREFMEDYMIVLITITVLSVIGFVTYVLHAAEQQRTAACAAAGGEWLYVESEQIGNYRVHRGYRMCVKP